MKHVVSLIMMLSMINVSIASSGVLNDWRLADKQTNYLKFINKFTNSFFEYKYIKLDKNFQVKNIANNLKIKFEGVELRPVPILHGWMFSYINKIPCAMIVSKKKEGIALISICGVSNYEDIKEMYLISVNEI
ncbi:MAG: hypothetical protein ACI4V7_02710 [Succinivibrionaceae bacterium]